MKSKKAKQILQLVCSLATMIAMAGTGHASIRIGGSAFFANGQLARDYRYTGPCPVYLKFDWGVIATDPATVTYWFRRSDGGHSSSSRTIDLPGDNRSVPILEEWRLGANTQQFFDYRGWVELNIDSPNPVSQRINFTIHCTDAPSESVRIGGSAFSANGQLARDYQYTGYCPVDLKFDWGVIAVEPTTVAYWIRRSDGGRSSGSRTVDLPGDNRSVPILEGWRLGANTQQFFDYRGWVELNIESPNRVANKIHFTIHCQ